MNKAKSIWLIICNTIFLILDALILLAVLFLFLSTILYLIGIICASFGKVECLAIKIIHCVFRYKEFDLERMIADFGVFASVSFIPIVSYLVSAHITNKNNNNRISEALAEAKSVNFYIATMPFGIWEGLEESYYSHCLREQRAVSDCSALLFCDYCLHLVFKGKFFQSYKIEVIEVGYEEHFENGVQLKKPKRKTINLYDTFTTDTTGTFCGEFIEGTSVVALVKDKNQVPLEYFLSAPSQEVSKNIFYELHIEQRDESERRPFKQMYCYRNNNLRFFPLIRFVYQIGVRHHRRITAYRLDMYVDSLPAEISQNNSKFKMAICDLDIRTFRKAPKRLKKARKKRVK